jgi:propanediol dehydratase small subunit
MKQLGALMTILVIGALIGLPAEIMRRRRLRTYWDRVCAGRDWRQAFPEADKDEIRKYLQVFVDAFAFRESRMLKFRPSDKIIDIYRACYPVKGWPDSLELESFAMMVERTYRRDLIKEWNPEMTLGQVFAMTRTTGMPSA